jgi:hypothetical protein
MRKYSISVKIINNMAETIYSYVFQGKTDNTNNIIIYLYLVFFKLKATSVTFLF